MAAFEGGIIDACLLQAAFRCQDRICSGRQKEAGAASPSTVPVWRREVEDHSRLAALR